MTNHAQKSGEVFQRLALPLAVGEVRVPNRVFCAPMSGVSDYPFRARALLHGAGLAVAEMTVASRAGEGTSRDQLRRAFPAGAVRIIQLAGRDPERMAEAARFCEAEGAEIIDINFGCPAKKVTGGLAGSALMREPDLAARLVEAIANAVKVPVTAKMRLGWEANAQNAPEIARLAVSAGARMITVHGRTRCQFYSGAADWQAVAAIRAQVDVPLVVNGDIATAQDAARALGLSGADAVMIGRGGYGQPWAAGLIAKAAGVADAGSGIPQTGRALADYVAAHHNDMLSLYGREQGMRHARKHLGWAMDRFAPNVSPELRTALLTTHDPAEAHRHIDEVFSSGMIMAEAA
jgi:tRNA-dihydrouridine synthase B